MKPVFAFSFFLFVGLSGPSFADTVTSADCDPVGPTLSASVDCTDIRVAFRTEISGCMSRLKAEADERAGAVTITDAHTSRARLFRCDASVREKLGLQGK